MPSLFNLKILTHKRNMLTEYENEYMMKKEVIEVDRAKLKSMIDLPSFGDAVKTALAVEVQNKDYEMSVLRAKYIRGIEIGTMDMVEVAEVNNKKLVVGFDRFLNNLSEVHAGLLFKGTVDTEVSDQAVDTSGTRQDDGGLTTLGSPSLVSPSLASPSLAASTSSSLTMQGGTPFPIAGGLPFAMAYPYNSSATGASSVSSGYEPQKLQPPQQSQPDSLGPRNRKTYMDILEENTKTTQHSLFKAMGALSEKTLLGMEGSKQVKEFRPDIVSAALPMNGGLSCLSFPYAEYPF